MLYTILRHIRNFFVAERHEGAWSIVDGVLLDEYGNAVDFIADGQRYIVEGSIFNDSKVFEFPSTEMVDEDFAGAIVTLRIPLGLIELSKEIEEWEKSYGNQSPYISESFGGYSYTKATGSTTATTWADAFRSRLNAWRKI